MHYSYHETHYKHLNGTGMKKKEKKKNKLLKFSFFIPYTATQHLPRKTV